MGKNDLIGGKLWENYSDEVARRMDNPQNRGEITEAEAASMNATLVVADWGAEACGDAVRLYWAVDPETHIIKKATFKSFGCGTAIASSDAMADLCVGKSVDEALQITNIEVEKELRDVKDMPAIPPQKMHCSVMAYDVIKKAASLYKKVDISELDEQDIVCECARVTYSTIRDVIRINDLKSVEEIAQYTKAGAFCKSCIEPGGHETRDRYLVDILSEVRAEMELEQVQEKSDALDFSDMGLVQKLRAIDTTLNKEVRPILTADGGAVEVMDIKESEGITEVFIQYQGACVACPSSKTATLSLIESKLRDTLSEKIQVIVM